MRANKIFLLILLIVLFNQCSDDDAVNDIALIDATSLFTRSASELKSYINISGLDLPLDEIKYDVEIFKITYKTTYKDEVITASALVILPETDTEIAMLSFQHGTIAAHDEAPTALPLNSQQLILYSALAAPGFIAVVPDFIGFGSSSNIKHPYYVETYTASVIIDALKAARNLAERKDLSFNHKLFLAGYSQGGYATMATHKGLEAKPLNGFELIASFPASGGYNIKGMQETYFSLETYDNPFFMAYVANSYKTTYDWEQPFSDFFQEPYATKIPALFDGSKNGDQINAELTTTVADFVTEDLLNNIDTDPDYSFIVDAFEENSLLDWTPTKPMFMYHGTADVTVFYQNSVDTYDHFIENGASEEVVTFIPLEGGTHGSGVAPYIEDFIPRLLTFR